MRLSSRSTHSTCRTVVALWAVASLAAAARAQLPADSRGEPLPRSVVAEQDSPVESAPEESVSPSFAGPILERSELTGDWLGRRTALAANGVAFDLSSTQYYQGVATGGLEQAFAYGGRNDYFLNFDGEQLGLCEGCFVTLHGETRYGESANTLAGTVLAPNLLLSVPQPDGAITALTGVTFTQVVTDELQIYGGKFNTLDDYEQPLTGAGSLTGFHNTAMLFNPVLARTVPYSTFGAGFTWLQDEVLEFAAVVYDTNDTPTVSGFDTFFDNGATIYAEAGVPTSFFDRPGHQGISGTYSSGTYTSLTPSVYLDPIDGLIITPGFKTGSWCLAYNFDQALYVSPEDPERLWGMFGNFGIADENPSPVRWFASAGISGASQIAGRQSDSFGMAYFYLGVSEPLKNLAPTLLPLRDEHGVELYYNMAITPWCQVTPDVQVITPFRDRAGTSLLVGLRVNVDL